MTGALDPDRIPLTRRVCFWAGTKLDLLVASELRLLEELDEPGYWSGDRNPYFGKVWPAAKALVEDVAERRPDLTGRRVLDLGCGTGVLGIFAAKRGAAATFADLMPEALRLAARNAARNGVRVAERLLDLRAPERVEPGFDLVLASDVLYEPWLAEALAASLPGLLAPDGVALVADPLRRSADRFPAAAAAHGFAVGERRRATGFDRRTAAVRVFELTRGAR